MRKVKLTAIALCIIIIAGVFAGCGSAAIPKPTSAPESTTPPAEVVGSCELKVEGSSITVSGETSFMDTTVISISVVAQSGMVIDSTDVTQQEDGKVDVTFQMTDDKYDGVKKITGFLTITPTKQNDQIHEKYGKKFEHIKSVTESKSGEAVNVVWNKDGNIVTFSSDPYEF